MNTISKPSQHSYLPFVLVMLVVGLIVTATSISILYRTSMKIEQEKIIEYVDSQARLIAAIAHFDAQFSSGDHPHDSEQATLSQLLETLNQRKSRENLDEVFLAHRDSQQKLILDHFPPNFDSSLALTGISAETLNLALDGDSGSAFGVNHQGKDVLAAYIGLPDIDRALVATVDIDELRKPFIRASIIATVVAIIIIIFGAIIFNQIQKLKVQSANRPLALDSHSGIKEYERFIYLIIVMTCICIAVNLSSTFALYNSSYVRSQEHLLRLIMNQAYLIESVAKFDKEYSQDDHPEGARGATLSQVTSAFNQSSGFGETGEYIIGQQSKKKNEIEIIYHQRFRDISNISFPLFSPQVEPMRQALQGNSGVMLSHDYRGHKVLAAYIPLELIDYGLVAKVDLSEIQAPFIRSILIATSISILLIVLASVLLARITRVFNDKSASKFNIEAEDISPLPLNLLLFTISLMSGIFFLDLISPIGIAGGAPYIAVVAMGWWFPQRKHIMFIAIFVSILSLVVFSTTNEILEWKSWINRCYSLFVIWVTALTLNLAKASEVARSQNARTLEKLSLAVEYSPNGVIITNPKGIVEYVNIQYLKSSKHAAEDIIGRYNSILNSAEASDTILIDMWKTIYKGKEWRGEVINRNKDGELFWEENAIFPIISREGKIQNFVCLKEDITQRKKMEEALQFQATHDTLTNLAGPALARDHLKLAIAQADRDRHKVAVLFIDLDGFKAINDTFGHKIGDLILQEVSERLIQSVRKVDTVARIGGDEFLVILGALHHPQEAETVAQKIITAISQPYTDIEKSYKSLNGTPDKNAIDCEISLGSSIGISIYPDTSHLPEDLIKRADSAMYTIKRQGKNNFKIYD